MKTPLIASAIGTALLLSACSLTPRFDSEFGQSNRMLQAQQTMFPQGTQGNPSTGIDGQATNSAYEQYQKTFKSPEPQPQAFTIGIGGSNK